MNVLSYKRAFTARFAQDAPVPSSGATPVKQRQKRFHWAGGVNFAIVKCAMPS